MLGDETGRYRVRIVMAELTSTELQAQPRRLRRYHE